MWDLLRNSVSSDSASKIVVGTPTGHRSEIVALALALNAVESGYRSLFFGPNLPAKDLAAAVKSNGAQAVALHIDDSKIEGSVESEIEKLQESLDDNTNILICTNDNSAMSELINFNGISITTLRNFRQTLENLTNANNSVDDCLMTRQFVTMEEFNNEMVT
jgi:cysteine synthase